MSTGKRFYVTTPIYYVNDEPHIGHAYTTILADVLARFHRNRGDDTYFLTGTDEHGQKVQQAAAKRGVSPQQHCDEYVRHFQDKWRVLNISFNQFIRTTQPHHIQTVQYVLQKLWEKDLIYQAEYEGWYSVAEERFLTQKEYEEGNWREVKRLSETNYWFKMSQFQEALINYIEEHPDFIQPEFRKNEVLGFLRKPLGDLCISRPKSRLSWGIELPFDRDYVTYVWFDALLNYVSAVGYPDDPENFAKWWPADVHLIGKDILTTHAVYWPTMLMAAELPLPKTIFAHGWWLVGETKMSKSLGNVVRPLELADKYGVDALRYFLMREMTPGQDASFTLDVFIQRYNSDLANDLGNLLNRITRLVGRYFQNQLPAPVDLTAEDEELAQAAVNLKDRVFQEVDSLRVNYAIEAIFEVLRDINRYLEQQAPWKVAKQDLSRAGTILYTAAEALRLVGGHLHPVMPGKIDELFRILGVSEEDLALNSHWFEWGFLKAGTTITRIGALFPRIEKAPPSEEQSTKGESKMEDTITIEEFQKVKLRVGTIVKAKRHPRADRLLLLKVDLGQEERQLVAGIAGHYNPEELVGRQIIVVANLQPAKIRGEESQGMLLAAEGDGKIKLLMPDGPVPNGSPIR